MNVSIGEYFEKFIQQMVAQGRYGSASEVVRDSLRMMEKHEARLQELRDTINRSIEQGGRVTPEELDAKLKNRFDELRTQTGE